jgi:hypothetical protein
MPSEDETLAPGDECVNPHLVLFVFVAPRAPLKPSSYWFGRLHVNPEKYRFSRNVWKYGAESPLSRPS